MSFNVTFTANTPEDLREKIENFAKIFHIEQGDTRQLSFKENATEKTPAQKTGKRGRPPKVQKTFQADPVSERAGVKEIQVSEAPEVDESNDVLEIETNPLPTRNDVMAALKAVNDTRGLETARALLTQFGCNKLSELKEDNFAAFIAAAETIEL